MDEFEDEMNETKNGVINALYVEKLDICQDTNGFIKPPADAHIL